MDTSNPSRPALEEAIRRAGSQTALARLIGKKQPHIHKWLHSPNALKAEHCIKIEAAVGVARQALRPLDYWDVWPELGKGRGSDRTKGAAHA